MKTRSVEELVYDSMFPRPKPSDPQNFTALLQHHLIPEVRRETHSYGHLETHEAKYPGLDYNHNIHRVRLSRWPWHRRLFRAFNALALTYSEIADMTKWEGTKWAKEKFEKEQGIIIRNTTADGLSDWVEPTDSFSASITRSTLGITLNGSPEDSDNYDNDDDHDDENNGNNDVDAEDRNEDELRDQESDDELESIDVSLNQRLRVQAARREAGETTAVLDEEWEQWLKQAIETGKLGLGSALDTQNMSQQVLPNTPSNISGTSVTPAALVPFRILAAARSGRWTEIPEFLRPALRRTVTVEGPGCNQAPTLPPVALGASIAFWSPSADALASTRQSWVGRNDSTLRLPLRDPAATSRSRSPGGIRCRLSS